MAVVAAFLRRRGIFIYPYLDDWLLKGSTPSILKSRLSFSLQLMSRFGLRVNLKKSMLNPSQRIHYLGASLDTVNANMCPSVERFSSIGTKCQNLLHSTSATVRQVSSLLGSMASCIFIVPNARLRMRPLQQALEDQWAQVSGRWEDQIVLLQTAKDSIRWWTKIKHHERGPLSSRNTYSSHCHRCLSDRLGGPTCRIYRCRVCGRKWREVTI